MTSPAEPAAGRRAVVVGTGLIGGSLALALRRRGWHVSGVDLDGTRLAEAVARGVVDEAGDDRDADVVFVAVPATAAPDVVRSLLADDRRRPDAVVTDVCGVKRTVVESTRHPHFVGGHPMAGSEQTGLQGADPDLFDGALWVLTPTAVTDLASFDRLKQIVMSLGADVLVLSPDDHDRLVAVVSHVPHLVAATLMNAANAGARQDRALLRLAAGGFRDMTRVAAGDAGIWPDICVENAPAILDVLDSLVTDLDGLRTQVAAGDRAALLTSLQRASEARRSLPAGAARPDKLAAVRIPVPDRMGVLAEITSVAAEAAIGIYDIEIAHSAEGPRGVVILVVEAAEAASLVDALERRGHRAQQGPLS
jgi:prephenate dehydrogenase